MVRTDWFPFLRTILVCGGHEFLLLPPCTRCRGYSCAVRAALHIRSLQEEDLLGCCRPPLWNCFLQQAHLAQLHELVKVGLLRRAFL